MNGKVNAKWKMNNQGDIALFSNRRFKP